MFKIAKTNLMIVRAAERRDSGSYSFTDLAQAIAITFLLNTLCKNFLCNKLFRHNFNYTSFTN